MLERIYYAFMVDLWPFMCQMSFGCVDIPFLHFQEFIKDWKPCGTLNHMTKDLIAHFPDFP